MNIKSEKIETIIQIINRNLQLICSEQYDNLTALNYHRLQQVDAIIFGKDKFAYEMIYFLTSTAEKINHKDQSIYANWERQFLTGLECLLVECSVISDEIERDCFVSRVYCWFNDKLAERKDIPRTVSISTEDLKNSFNRMGISPYHTSAGLDSLTKNPQPDHRKVLMNSTGGSTIAPVGTTSFGNRNIFDNNLDLPPIDSYDKMKKLGARKIPLYVKHSYPSVLETNRPTAESLLPVLPGADDNYGLLYSVPSTEAEIKLNELWLAKRKEEAFKFKTKEQLNIVMDRLALNKSRVESEFIRRKVSDAMLKNSIKNNSLNLINSNGYEDDNEFVEPPTFDEFKNKSDSNLEKKVSNSTSRAKKSRPSSANTLKNVNILEQRLNNTYHFEEKEGKVRGTISLVVSGNTYDKEKEETQVIPTASRTLVINQSKNNGKKEFAPMRFKNTAPDSLLSKTQYYMHLSDSDDDDANNRTVKVNSSGTNNNQVKKAPKKSSSSSNAPKQEYFFKRNPMEIRERPLSAKLFKELVTNDDEFKIFYRHTNYRRMPLTQEHQDYLEKLEKERVAHSNNLALQFAIMNKQKSDKKGKKNGKDGKGKDKKAKDTKKKNKKNDPDPSTDANEKKCKYSSASHFMTTNFPSFESTESVKPRVSTAPASSNSGLTGNGSFLSPLQARRLKKLKYTGPSDSETETECETEADDEDEDEDDDESEEEEDFLTSEQLYGAGPMRIMQLNEIKDVMKAFEKSGYNIKESTLRKALLIPQDKPDTIALDNLKGPYDGHLLSLFPNEGGINAISKGKGKKKKGKRRK